MPRWLILLAVVLIARTTRNWQRYARRGTTAQRGYGPSHRAERRRRLAMWRPGDPCARCGLPMYGPAQFIDLGHTADRSAYTGLEHRSCNRGEGARRGNLMRGTRQWKAARQWLRLRHRPSRLAAYAPTPGTGADGLCATRRCWHARPITAQ